MPAVSIDYPRELRERMDKTDWLRLKRDIAQIIADRMDAIDPDTEMMTKYGANPGAFIDLMMVPYDMDDVSLTTPLLGKITSYAWPNRMDSINERLKAICELVKKLLMKHMPDHEGELISFTFYDKQPGCWAYA